MKQTDWTERISIDANVCHGKPCISGARIMVSIILDYLKAGKSVEAILKEYPALQEPDPRAAISSAAWLAHQEEECQLSIGQLTRAAA